MTLARPERRWLAMLTVSVAAAYALVALFRHWHFSSNAYDLGIFDQVIWKLSRFETPASSINGHGNIFGDHFHPIIVLLAPLYWIYPAAETLLAAQAIVLAVSAIPVYLFLRRRFSAGITRTVTIAYASFWGMQRTAWFDFHEIAFAPLFVALMVWCIDGRRWRGLWLAGLALMLVKEDMAPFVAGCGAYLFLTGWRRQGAALAATGIVYFGVVMAVVIPALSTMGGWGYESAFETLRHAPWKAPLLLMTPMDKLRTILYWLAPFLFLPLRSPLSLMLVPIALERLLSENPNHWSPGGHYSAPLAPLLAMAAGDGLAAIAAGLRDDRRRRQVVAGAAAAMLVLCALIPGHQPLLRLFAMKHYRPVPYRDAAARALAIIPPHASVVAQSPIVPHLSERDEIYLLDEQAPDADFVVVAPDDVGAWPVGDAGDIRRLVDARIARGYEVRLSEGNWMVLARP